MPRDPAERHQLEATTFANLLDRVRGDTGLSANRRRDLASAIRTFVRLLDLDPAHAEAGIKPHRAKIQKFYPASAGISRKRWSNIRSDLGFALDRYRVKYRRPSPRDLSPAWLALRDQARETHIRFVRGLSALIHYCNARGIEPDAVNDAVIDRFHDYVRDQTFNRRPNRVHRRTCMLWNRAREAIPGWPQTLLTVPCYRGTFSLPLANFPEPFQHELKRWLARLAGQDILANEVPDRPLRPATLKNKREQVRRFASALVNSGSPLNQITSLSCLVEPAHFREAVRYLLDRAGGPIPSLFELAYTMTGIAKHWAKVGEKDLEELQALTRRLKCREKGLTARNRERLRQFDDPLNQFRLLELPSTLVTEARKQRNSRRAALLVQTAFAVELLLMAPIRLGNLLSLRLDTHFDYSRSGRKGIVHLVIPAHEVKNRQLLEFELPGSTVELLDLYGNNYLPILSDGTPNWLFPGQKGGAKHAVTLSGQIVRAIRDRTGLSLNVHAFRHLAAKLYLGEHPGAYGLVSRLLGHKAIQTTLDFYADFETAAAENSTTTTSSAGAVNGQRTKDLNDDRSPLRPCSPLPATW